MTLPGKRIQESHKQEEKSGIYVRFPSGETQNPAVEVASQSPVAKMEREASQTGGDKKSNKMILKTAGSNNQNLEKGNASGKNGGTKREKKHKNGRFSHLQVTGKAQQGDKYGQEKVWFQNCNT